MRREVNYACWNPEAKVLLVFMLLWFVHPLCFPLSKVFLWTWVAHWAVAGVWGFSYLWRVGDQAHRLRVFQRTWGRHGGRRNKDS